MARLRPVGYEDRLSIVEHLDELRTRLIWCIVVFVAVSPCASSWLGITFSTRPVKPCQSGHSCGLETVAA